MLHNPFPSTTRTVGVFAAAKFPPPELYQEGLRKLSASGVCYKTAIPPRPWRFFAGTDDERLSSLQQLLDDPEVDLLLAACGGSGTARLLPGLDWPTWRRRNLPTIGYSDLTALHLAALRHGCRRHIHGPMLCRQWGDHAAAYAANMDSLAAALNNCEDLLPDWHGARILQPGQSCGQLIPANLTLLCSLLGTAFLPELARAILVIEDVHLPAHALDRCLNQLRQSGLLDKLAGLIYGQFSDCEDAQYVPDILTEYATYVQGPVLCDLQFGHLNPSISLPVGRLCSLQAEKQADIRLRLDRREKYEPLLFFHSGQELPYRLLRPAVIQPGKKYPLLLLLHGAGERGQDNVSQLAHLAEVFARPENLQQYPCYVLLPQCPEGSQWVDSPWNTDNHLQPRHPSQPLQLAMALLNNIQRENPIAQERIYVLGLSMGGFGTWDAICRYPELFAAAVPICGGGDPEQAQRLRGLPIWAFHGSADNAVPAILTRRMVQAVQQAGGDIRYTEFAGVGHNSWAPALAQPELLEWLFQQRKS